MHYKVKNHNTKDEWLEARKAGLTGTEMAALMGFSSYMTPLDVFNNKFYDTQPTFTDDQHRRMYWGSRLEDIVKDEFFLRLDREHEVIPLGDYDIVTHNQHPYMIGTPDGLFKTADGLEVLEVKTTGYLSKEWGEELTDQVPANYFIQTAWYMMLVGAVRGHIALLVGGQTYKHYVIEADEDKFSNMRAAAKAFWFQNIKLGLPPMPQSEKDLKSRYPKADPEKTVSAPSNLKSVLVKLKEVKAEISSLEDVKKDLEYQVKSFIGDAAIMLDESGCELATYKNQTRNSFDSVGFKKDYPELYAKYMKAGSFRKFDLKERNI